MQLTRNKHPVSQAAKLPAASGNYKPRSVPIPQEVWLPVVSRTQVAAWILG